MFGNSFGGWLTAANTVFTLIVLVILDWIIPEDESHPEETGDLFANTILIIHVFVNTTAIGLLLVGIYNGFLTGTFMWFAILSTGINSGMSGIIVAHECIHRKSLFFRILGSWNLVNVLYIHWYVEHKYGHHKWVGTFKDPATARLGETVYRFIARTIPQQFASALKIEWERQRRKGRNPWGLHNFLLRGFFVQYLYIFGIYYIFGLQVLTAFFIQALVAILLLELVNYIEHYGLLREVTQPFDVELAWNTNVLSSRYFLLELVRHSDHHLKSYKPYQSLVPYDDVPTLPAGYWGMFYITLIPRWWRGMIHPLIPDKMKRLYFELKDLPIPKDLAII